MKTEDLPNGTSSVFEGAASEAEPAAAKARAAHTPPIDIIGGRCLTLYSDGTPSVFEGGPAIGKHRSRSGAPHNQGMASAVFPGRRGGQRWE